MDKWFKIETENDVSALMEMFYGFHDSCITSINYKSGNKVDEDNSMVFATEKEYQLNVIFESQYGDSIELCFNGVRRMHLVGMQDNYLSDIYDASIKIYDNIMPCQYTTSKRFIVWSDNENFDITNIHNDLAEPSVTYIIAHYLKWRKLSD